jgi:hypothetical protein
MRPRQDAEVAEANIPPSQSLMQDTIAMIENPESRVFETFDAQQILRSDAQPSSLLPRGEECPRADPLHPRPSLRLRRLTMLLDVGKRHCYRSLMAEVAPQH